MVTSGDAAGDPIRLEQLEDGGEIADVLAAGRRGPADIVEQLAVPDAVIGEPLDPAALVEIDGNHPLVDHALRHEGDRALGALGDVIKGLAAHGGHRRGRAEHDQDLLLARPDRDLLERPLRHDVAALIGLGEAAAEPHAHGQHGRRDLGGGKGGRARRSRTMHAARSPYMQLHSTARLTYWAGLPPPKRSQIAPTGPGPLSYPDDISPVSPHPAERQHRVSLWHDRGTGASARLLPNLPRPGYS